MSIIDIIWLSTTVYYYAPPVCHPVGYQVKISGQVWHGSKGVWLDINTRFSFRRFGTYLEIGAWQYLLPKFMFLCHSKHVFTFDPLKENGGAVLPIQSSYVMIFLTLF